MVYHSPHQECVVAVKTPARWRIVLLLIGVFLLPLLAAAQPDSLQEELQRQEISADRLITAKENPTPTFFRSPPPTQFHAFYRALSPWWVMLSSSLLPGSGQIMNEEYWKVPLVYGTIGGFAGLGVYFHKRSRFFQQELSGATGIRALQIAADMQASKLYRNLSFTMMGVCYALSVADAVIVHERGYQSPTAALISSIILPGLGQIYNRSYWKIPIIYGAGLFFGANAYRFHILYRRFDRALTELLDENPATVDEFQGKRSERDLTYFRDYYLRNRDWYIIGTALVYVLNMVDAYVDAYLYDWNVDDNLSASIRPALLAAPHTISGAAVGMSLNVRF